MSGDRTMAPHAPARRGVAALVLLALGAAGCAANVSVATERCREAPGAIVAELASRVEEPGQLRNAFAVQSTEFDRIWLVSAEFLPEGQEEDRAGDIFTWATSSLDSPQGDYVSVDPNARDRSGWPPAGDLTVKADGAIESRACVDEVRPDQGNTGLLG